MEQEVASLRGPVERVDGKLVLRIPLEAGGDRFVECSKGISEVSGECLIVSIPEFISGLLRIEAGDLVDVDNANGKFNIHPVNPRAVQ